MSAPRHAQFHATFDRVRSLKSWIPCRCKTPMKTTAKIAPWAIAGILALTPSYLVAEEADGGAAGKEAPASSQKTTPYAEILVLDADTDRGVPLVELRTVNHLHFVTDSAGRIAFHEPGLMGRPVFFHVRSHGYEFPKDGFGYAGKALTLAAGETATLRVRRLNVAERLYRITGEGIYRDSVLLGKPTPLQYPLGGGRVAGQDSAFTVPYRGRLFWFWGDTSRMRYPLGHFWMAGATSKLPGSGGLDPAVGIDLEYFVDENGFSRPLCRLGVERGLIWADAFAAVPDADGKEHLVCHYAHMESFSKMLGRVKPTRSDIAKGAWSTSFSVRFFRPFAYRLDSSRSWSSRAMKRGAA